MRWISLSVLSVLIGALALLQLEVNDLKTQLAKVGSVDQKVAAAVKQFEKDLFARMRADEKTRLGILAEQEAQRNRAIQEGLNRLPLGDFDRPQHWQ